MALNNKAPDDPFAYHFGGVPADPAWAFHGGAAWAAGGSRTSAQGRGALVRRERSVGVIGRAGPYAAISGLLWDSPSQRWRAFQIPFSQRALLMLRLFSRKTSFSPTTKMISMTLSWAMMVGSTRLGMNQSRHIEIDILVAVAIEEVVKKLKGGSEVVAAAEAHHLVEQVGMFKGQVGGRDKRRGYSRRRRRSDGDFFPVRGEALRRGHYFSYWRWRRMRSAGWMSRL